MYRTLSIFGVALFAFIAIALMGDCLQAQQIQIKMEDGIPVVYNPKEPVALPNTPSHLTLIEDIRLGEPDENNNYPFSMLSWICVDDRENIITMDNEEACIRIFDKAGKLIRKFGRKGQGPGEFQYVAYLSVIEGEKIGVIDPSNHRFYHFSQDGECLKQIDLGKYWRVGRAKADSRGFLYANFMTMTKAEEEVRSSVELIKFDPDFQPIATLGTYEESRKRNEVNMVEKRFGFDLRGDNVLVWGISTEYVLNFMDSNGKLIRRVVKDYERIRLTDEDRERQYKLYYGDRKLPPEIKLNYPSHFFPFFYVMCDDEGRTYVRTYQKDDKGDFIFDVFDSQGRYFAKFARPESEMPIVVKKGKFYSIKFDREDLPLLTRYRMVWE